MPFPFGPDPLSGAERPFQRPREPIFNLPGAVVWLIGLLAVVHIARLALPFERDLEILREFAVTPARFALEFGWLDPARLAEQAIEGLGGEQASERMAVARYFVDGAGPRWWSLLSYGLLHAGSAHIAMNCLWLAVFGSPLARRVGGARFWLLVAAGTIAGAAAHIFIHPSDVMPLVGASAGVSAATGAAARFVFAGGLRFGAMAHDDVVRSVPALSLVGMLSSRPTMIFVVLWFVSNWLFGAGVVPLAGADQSIAWEAHVGGFVAGLLLFPLLDRRPVI